MALIWFIESNLVLVVDLSGMSLILLRNFLSSCLVRLCPVSPYAPSRFLLRSSPFLITINSTHATRFYTLCFPCSHLPYPHHNFLSLLTKPFLTPPIRLAVALGCTLSTPLRITDQVPMYDLMKQNIALNGLDSLVSASIYDWGDSPPATIPAHPDIILAADCVYFEPAFPLLQKTLQDLIGEST
jgi:hypothetical protein